MKVEINSEGKEVLEVDCVARNDFCLGELLDLTIRFEDHSGMVGDEIKLTIPSKNAELIADKIAGYY